MHDEQLEDRWRLVVTTKQRDTRESPFCDTREVGIPTEYTEPCEMWEVGFWMCMVSCPEVMS